MIRALLFAAAMSATMCVLADNSSTPAAEEHPGYGVVQSITPVRVEPAEESASAGSSAPSQPWTTYLVKVKLDDGSIQVRQLKKRSVAVGKRVLITNAGDVLPE
jgi:outer membrane lipoprotein SlyB